MSKNQKLNEVGFSSLEVLFTRHIYSFTTVNFRQLGVSVLLNYTSTRFPLRLNQNENSNMAQGPFLLSLYWESQYLVVFEITRMEIAEHHEVQLTVEGELGALCLDYLSPGWVEFVIFLRNFATSEIGLVGVQQIRFLISRQKLWGALREPTPPHFLL